VTTAVNGAAIARPTGDQRRIYDGLLTFNERNHQYKWNGKHVPSVTGLCERADTKETLIAWAARIGAETGDPKAYMTTRDEAAAEGREIHEYARACFHANNILPLPVYEGSAKREALSVAKIHAGCAAFSRWFEKVKPETVFAEHMVMSLKFHYAGRMDFYGRVGGRPALLDVKTGNTVCDKGGKLYLKYKLQLLAYERAIHEEMGELRRLTRYILHLNKRTEEFILYRQDPMAENVDIKAWCQFAAAHPLLKALEAA
jgi:hypothetical protein